MSVITNVLASNKANPTNCGLRLAEVNKNVGLTHIAISIMALVHGVVDKTPSKTLFLAKAFPDTEGKPDASFTRMWSVAKQAYAVMPESHKALVRDGNTIAKSEKAALDAIAAHMSALNVTTLKEYMVNVHFHDADERNAAGLLADQAAAEAAAEAVKRDEERAANLAALEAAKQAEAANNPAPTPDPVAMENVTTAPDTLATLPTPEPLPTAGNPVSFSHVKDVVRCLNDDELAELAAFIYLVQKDRAAATAKAA